MYKLFLTTRFKKDLKRLKKQTSDFNLASQVLHILQRSGVKGIPETMKPHKLKGNYKDNWECHIKPDLLIIWFQIEEDNSITLIRIGSHSDLFK